MPVLTFVNFILPHLFNSLLIDYHTIIYQSYDDRSINYSDFSISHLWLDMRLVLIFLSVPWFTENKYELLRKLPSHIF